MLVPVSWLKEYVDIDLPVTELAEKLTVAGLEVKEIRTIGLPVPIDPEALIWDREKLVIGQILNVEPHPDADRLFLAAVEYGGDSHEVVVTGAPNLIEYLGKGDLLSRRLFSPLALEGVTLYDGHKEGRVKMTLKGRKLRGVYNRCMLCSEKELGISDEHQGIIILHGDYQPGTPVQDVLGDAILDIDIIPNIARCASIIGVAREVAALTGQTLQEPDYKVNFEGPLIENKVTISTDSPELNPRFVAMVISGVEQKPSPEWMQRRLRLAGQRPINVVVDISNYVMLEMGQPNHTFDYDFLRLRADAYNQDGPIHLHTRLPLKDETLTTLDGEEHELAPYNILVTDPAGNLSLGGIMGGIESEINEKTTNVLLEAAAWNYLNIRRSATALRINSEAAFRFSRGVHPSQAPLGAKRAAELLRRYAGGTVASGIIDSYPNPPEIIGIRLEAEEVSRIGGIGLSLSEITQLLRSLAFSIDLRDDHLMVTPPDHRIDIEGTADLIEEVCRMYGYNRIPTKEMSDTLPPQRNNRNLELEERIKDILTQLGLQEVITYRLTTPEQEARLYPKTITIPDDRPYLTLANPISRDRVSMRHSLLASVLEVAAGNSRYAEQIAIFELGKIFIASEYGPLPDEFRRLVLVMTGLRNMEHWQDSSVGSSFDLFDLKGVIEELFSALRVPDVNIEAGDHPSYRPGHSARITIGNQQLGVFGEIHPMVVEEEDILGDWPILAAELDLEILIPAIPGAHQVTPPPIYPAINEDIAVVVDKDVSAADITNAVNKIGGYLLKSAALFDVYEGEPIPSGKKSLAYHLTFQAPDKTLTDKTVRKNRERIVSGLRRQFGARLRDC